MILDQMDNWPGYCALPAWGEAMRFVAGLGPDTPDGDYELRGRDIWARVFSYTTKPLPDGVLEAHREYVDVQALLAGQEIQVRCPVRDLRVRTAYDPAADVEFFEHPAAYPATWLLVPGMFAAFFPQDAHLTQGMMAAPAPVKKVVAKVRCALLTP
ncbi:MAG: YhcH/YjgK/YiaL family protein [Thermodesulfobacteriota bacterium]